ncbi:MAG TPA: dienelactone hydrolase family protein [Actinomycetota bacterium]|nr:dienelactone hydrolase family protein [Actinomycetota bacterium]
MRSLQHPTEPPPEGPSWSAGEHITFGGLSDKGSGYMAYSERVGPSVLVLHDAYGLLPSVRALTDRFVSEGFTALAVDLYEGKTADGADAADAMAAGLDILDTMKRLTAAVEHLSSNWHPRLGLVGFSAGASLATMLAREVDVDATVVYYGGGAGLEQSWAARPLLGHFARGDDFEPASSALQAIATLNDAEAFSYDAPHGFANANLTGYDQSAAELALERTLEELHYQLS